MLPTFSLLLLFTSLCGGVSAAVLAPHHSASPLPTPPPHKRAENNMLIGSRESDGRWTTSQCQMGSTFTISGSYAGCVAPGEQPATACAQNDQDEQSIIVDGSLWCTHWCFTRNTIYTTAEADPFIMMNCFGDYKLLRYVDAETTGGATESGQDFIPTTQTSSVTSTQNDGDVSTEVVENFSASSFTTDSGDVNTATIPESVPPKNPPSDTLNEKKGGLTNETIIGLVVGIVTAILTLVSVWVAIVMCRRGKKVSHRGSSKAHRRHSAMENGSKATTIVH